MLIEEDGPEHAVKPIDSIAIVKGFRQKRSWDFGMVITVINVNYANRILVNRMLKNMHTYSTIKNRLVGRFDILSKKTVTQREPPQVASKNGKWVELKHCQ